MVVHCGWGRLSGAAWSHLPSCWCDTATALSTISNVASGSLVLFSSNIVSVTLKILGNASFSFVTSVILKQFLMTIYFLAAFKYWDFWEPFQVPSISGSLLRLLHFSGSLSNEKAWLHQHFAAFSNVFRLLLPGGRSDNVFVWQCKNNSQTPENVF